MRGQKLFKNLISEDEAEKSIRRGRNDDLLERRNSCLVARYYYYGRYKGKCFEEILQIMVSEFFLTPSRIVRIIRENIDTIKAIKEKNISVYQLQNAWPQFKW